MEKTHLWLRYDHMGIKEGFYLRESSTTSSISTEVSGGIKEKPCHLTGLEVGRTEGVSPSKAIILTRDRECGKKRTWNTP